MGAQKGKGTTSGGGGGGAVCAADAMVSDSQWTALDDSRHKELFGEAFVTILQGIVIAIMEIFEEINFHCFHRSLPKCKNFTCKFFYHLA